jgi:hypothetical protein
MTNSLPQAFIILLIFVSTKVLSQGMIPVQSAIRSPYGNVPHTYYVPNPMRYYGQGKNNTSKQPYTIILKSDSCFTASTRIYLSEDKHYIIVKKRKVKRQIFPAETKTISCKDIDGSTLIGIPADSCWFFKISKGRINSYSFIPEKGMYHVTAIQEGNGPIVPLNEDNVRKMVEGNTNALELVKREELIKAIQTFNEF